MSNFLIVRLTSSFQIKKLINSDIIIIKNKEKFYTNTYTRKTHNKKDLNNHKQTQVYIHRYIPLGIYMHIQTKTL